MGKSLGPDADEQREETLLVAVGLCSIYSLVITVWRLIDLSSLPKNLEIHPDLPPWLLTYWWSVTVSLFIISSITIALLLMRIFDLIEKRILFIVPGLLLIGWIVVHGLFSLDHKAVAEGGILPGIVHILSLTSYYTGYEPFSILSYRIGQVLGMLCWGVYALLLMLLSGVYDTPRPESPTTT